MTPEQCQKLRDAIPRSFPSIQAWWDRLRDDATREAMTRRNSACLIDCDYDDCVAVLKEFLTSDVDPWPYDGDKERSAATIAKAANERRRERKERERGPAALLPASPYARPKGVLSIWEQSERLTKYRASDAWTKDGEEDLLAEMLGPEDSTDKRNWVACRDCRDTGVITVLSTIRWVRPWQGKGEPRIVHTTGAAACSCSAASEYLNRKVPLPAYDVNRHVKCESYWQGPQVAAALEEWKRTTADAKRYKGFDEFNSRQPQEKEF